MDCTPNSTNRVALGPQVFIWRQGDSSVRQPEANHLAEGSSLQHFRVPYFPRTPCEWGPTTSIGFHSYTRPPSRASFRLTLKLSNLPHTAAFASAVPLHETLSYLASGFTLALPPSPSPKATSSGKAPNPLSSFPKQSVSGPSHPHPALPCNEE